MEITIPLKLKYNNRDVRVMKRLGLDPPEGTKVWLAESFAYKTRTGNSHGEKKRRSSTRPRKRAYGPF